MDGLNNILSVYQFDTTKPVDKVDVALNCVCLQKVSEDETDRSTTINSILADGVEIRERYGMVPIPSIFSVFHFVRSYYALKELAQKLPWPAHRFYHNRFYHTKTQE